MVYYYMFYMYNIVRTGGVLMTFSAEALPELRFLYIV